MRFLKENVWQALLATLCTLSSPVFAETRASFDPASGSVVVSGLEQSERDRLVYESDVVRLTLAGQKSTRSMPLTLSQDGDSVVVLPRFSLKEGKTYILEFGTDRHEISLPAPTTTVPKLVGFAPSQSVIPENTLRIYLSFSEPMARGMLLDAVRLFHSGGSEVKSPFLNLDTELWDRSQMRATMLLDPGRIKQGVGPNITNGAPLEAGQSYRLLVAETMKSAKGIALEGPVAVVFRVGQPERRAINPSNWQIQLPSAGSLEPFSVSFDRIMDNGAVRRLLALKVRDGSHVTGQIHTDGGGWSLTPDTPWKPGDYTLVIDPELEDVSGNTPGAPFDSSAGTIGTVQDAIVLEVEIASK